MKTVRQHLRGRVKSWVARKVGISSTGFWAWIRNNAVPQHRAAALAAILGVDPSEIPISAPKLADPRRTDEWERRYRAGETLEQIGQAFGVTRERVRQLLARRGMNREDGGIHTRAEENERRRQEQRHQQCLSKFGCTREEYLSIPRAARLAHREQRNNARNRGIEWRFPVWAWWQFWLASGKWEQRGRTRGSYVMSRVGDRGPYAPGNVRITQATANVAEYYDRERATYGRVRRNHERKAA